MTNQENRQTRWQFLDFAFVLLSSIAILLFGLWIVFLVTDRKELNTLPPWISSAFSNVWTFLISGVGAATVKFVGRRRRDAPNPLAWTMLTTLFLITVVVVLKFAVVGAVPGPGLPKPTVTTTLIFKMDDDAITDMTFYQKAPQLKSPVLISRQQPDGSFVVPIDMPEKGNSFIAKAVIAVTESVQFSEAPEQVEICFSHSGNCQQKDPLSISLLRRAGFFHSVDPTDCDIQLCAIASIGNGLPTFRNTFYQPAIHKWIVPSLAMLNKSASEKSYTVFTYHVRGFRDSMQDADSYAMAIKVNEIELYVDGFKPGDIRLPVSNDTLTVRYGLENLNFSGADGGVEHITTTLTFYKGDLERGKVELPIDYVAIRVMPLQRGTASPASTSFTWETDYKYPKAREYEVFISAAKSREASMRTQREIDALGLRFGSSRVKAVIRPPLKSNPNFGIAFGVESTSGQINFTFSKSEADKIVEWAKTGTNKRYFGAAYSYLIGAAQRNGTR